jgi:phosphoesterase RecJ-like protein
VRPDGDCLGGQVALARGLLALGKRVVVLNTHAPTPELDYLREDVDFQVFAGAPLPEHDVVALLDFNQLSRTGPMEGPIAAASSRKLVIDHHPHEGEPWWDASFVDVSASATGVLVWRILASLGVQPDRGIARGVFTSLVSDTGWFRYSNTDAETLAIASELVALGVEPSQVYGAIHQRRPADEPRAMAGVLGSLAYHAGGRLAVVDQPLGNGGAPPLEDGDPVLDVLRSVEEVDVVLYLREVEPGSCKLSARSKTDFDVNRLARRFGGGGHVKASGATIAGSLAEVRERVVAAALELLTAHAADGGGAR